ncbi:hypothetical protein BH23ACT4_BH23ACT4_00900 [soil metagenome]
MQCVKCGRRAAFICPIGTMCPTDALLAAAFHDWIPARIRPEDRLERVPPEYLDAYPSENDLSGHPTIGRAPSAGDEPCQHPYGRHR